MIGCGASAWPSENGAIQVLLVVAGLVLLFGGFGRLFFYRESSEMREVDMRGLLPAALDRINRIFQNLLGLLMAFRF